MSRFANTLIQTLVLDESEGPPNYEGNPFGSHFMLRSRKIIQTFGVDEINAWPIKWVDEDALNHFMVCFYRKVTKDVGNKLDHEVLLCYLRKHPDFLGPETGPRRAQIICKPENADQLAEQWEFLNPTVYAVKYLRTDSRRLGYYLLPSPEILGVSSVQGDNHGIFVRESRRVVMAYL